MSETDKKEDFREWVKSQEEMSKKNIPIYKTVLKIEERKLSIILELKKIDKHEGDKAKSLMEEHFKLMTELKKLTINEIKEFLETAKNTKSMIPDFYS
ncbi:hypothetical protein LCGC14_0618890 [marine sediment metagenome]|uniref:Uncharacterized protein n=1 Tax=marine sediment metagenome TaxID=412755 RepID=A0A0F9RAB9_9ZZZZ